MNIETILPYLARILALFTAIPIHESAHGLTAYRLGDPTAKAMGRITLNPFKHFDMFGTLSLMLIGIGWAKPVPVDARYFKRPKLGMVLTAFAGPLSNFLLAYVLMVIYKIVFYSNYTLGNASLGYTGQVVLMMVIINCMLAVFNMLPVPPFDGGRIATAFLPEKWYFGIMKYERYIYFVVLAVLFLGLLDTPLGYMQKWMVDALDALTRYVDLIAFRIMS